MNTYKKLSSLILVFTMISLLIISCTESEKKAVENSPAKNVEEQLSPAKEFIEIDIEEISKAKKGDEFLVKNSDQDTTFTLIINKVQTTLRDMQSISANINNKETGFAALTIRDNELRGSMEFYTTNSRYRIAYDSASGKYYMQLENRDNLEGSNPLTPPTKQ